MAGWEIIAGKEEGADAGSATKGGNDRDRGGDKR